MCVHASTHSRSHTGSMNIIMWPVGHKHSESIAEEWKAWLPVRCLVQLHGHHFMEAFIWISELCWQEKALAKACQPGPEPDSEYASMCADECDCDCSHVLCDWKKTDRGEIRGGQEVRVIHCVSIVQLSDERVWMSHTQARTLCE